MADSWPWLTKSQACELIGCGPANFDQRIRDRLGKGAAKGTRAKLRFHAAKVVEAWVAHRVEIEAATAQPTTVEETELDKGRAIDNDQKRVRLMKELGRVVAIEHVRPGLMIYATAVREAGAMLAKRYGDDAAEILNERVQAGERDIAGYFDSLADQRPASPDGDDEREPVGAAAIDSAVRRG